MLGRQFGRLTVLECVGRKNGQLRWHCACACGGDTVVAAGNLGRSTWSCGCVRAERSSTLNRTHGLSKTAEYRIWRGIRTRCRNSACAAYKNYGGRGITICDRWAQKFAHFLEDMGPRPGPRYSIERKDNDGPYCKDNCIWATPAVQARNTRRSLFLTIGGERLPVAEWAARAGLPVKMVRLRLWSGWSAEEAIGPRRRPLRTPSARVNV